MSPLVPIVAQILRDDVSENARIESRNREVFLPPVGVYRWWARRTGAVNRALIEGAEAVMSGKKPLLIADPFAGGGVIPIVALQSGHDVYAQDLNPWATEGLLAAARPVDRDELAAATKTLLQRSRALMNKAYATNFLDGSSATISHTFRVAVGHCPTCDARVRLYPHALVSRVARKDTKKGKLKGAKAFIACRNGHLYLGHANSPSQCPECRVRTSPDTAYLDNREFKCPCCKAVHTLSEIATHRPFDWDVVLVERSLADRREIGPPTPSEIEKASSKYWTPKRIKDDEIPELPETAVLRRHGFTKWSDLYPGRQRWITQKLLALVVKLNVTENVRAALRIAILGTVEMAGHLSRWDRHYLKSYEAMASHRFNFTTFTAEPNLIGLNCRGRGSLANRLASLRKSNDWLLENTSSKGFVALNRSLNHQPAVQEVQGLTVVTGSSDRLLLADRSVDLILTDPPYHDDVQYHDLSLPFRVWAGLPMDRGAGDAVAVPHSKALISHRSYRSQLAKIFIEFRRILKPSGRLVFSYANREPAAWVNLFAALRDAKLNPLAYTILHAENETEIGKSNRRSCTQDLILELTPSMKVVDAQWRPCLKPTSDEERYLIAVGDAFLKSATLVNGWEDHLVTELMMLDFLSSSKSKPMPNRLNRAQRQLQSEHNTTTSQETIAL